MECVVGVQVNKNSDYSLTRTSTSGSLTFVSSSAVFIPCRLVKKAFFVYFWWKKNIHSFAFSSLGRLLQVQVIPLQHGCRLMKMHYTDEYIRLFLRVSRDNYRGCNVQVWSFFSNVTNETVTMCWISSTIGLHPITMRTGASGTPFSRPLQPLSQIS